MINMTMQDVCSHCHHKRENHMLDLDNGGSIVIFLIAVVMDLKIKNK
jgi:hypothetical protein